MIYRCVDLIPLERLLSSIKDKQFSIQTQYKFLKINKIIRDELGVVEEQRRMILDSYAELDEKGHLILGPDGGIKIKDECIEECAQKMIELNGLEIQIPDIYFSLDELEPIGLTLGQLELLEPFIK